MPNKFKINRPISDELLTHIQAHPKVTSVVTTNAGNDNEFTTVNLDQNYTGQQIRDTAIDYIITKQQQIIERLTLDAETAKAPEYEI